MDRKELIIFDLDGTLAESKQPITPETAAQVARLLARMKVAVVSGGALPQFLTQVVAQLPADANLPNLSLLPTSGAALYEYENNEWKKMYEERIPENDAEKIQAAIEEGARESGVVNLEAAAYGPRTEYRGSEVTFSALGQEAPFAEKRVWDPDHAKRRALQAAIQPLLPAGYEARMGGATSIDINRAGIDKAYGIHQLSRLLSIPESAMLYVGDELIRYGNDEAVFKTAVQTRAVSGPAETLAVIEELLR